MRRPFATVVNAVYAVSPQFTADDTEETASGKVRDYLVKRYGDSPDWLTLLLAILEAVLPLIHELLQNLKSRAAT